MIHNEQIEAVFQRILNVPLIDEAQRRARDGEAEMQHALMEAGRATGIRTSALQGTDLRDIPFPEIPFYDGKHGFMVSQLADSIGNTLKLSDNDLRVVRTAGLYHDLGRQTVFSEVDPKHNERSAEMAHKLMTGAKDGHGDRAFIDKVCGYIARHQVGVQTIDLLAQALHDADALEAARIMPGTTTGMLAVRRAQTCMLTPFGRNKDAMRRMMVYHGW